MESSIWKRAAKFLREHKSHRNWAIFVVCLALVVTVGTITVLRYTGSAMTRAGRVLDCPLSVHEHTYDCYDDDGDIVCGLADYVVHTHNGDCYDKDGALACTLPEIAEHRHSASCYTTETVLTCGRSESAGHEHSSDCYESEADILSCGYDEHTHSDDCYTYDEETEESYLSCGYSEHTHSGDCYTAGGSYLACGYDEGEGAHWHSDSCYETREVRTCGKLELHTHDDYDCYDEYGDLTCTKTVLEEHEHTDACFVTVTVEEAAAAAAAEADEAEDDTASDEPAEEASDEPEADDQGIITQTVSTEHYIVSVSYGAEANIPADAELRVVEYGADSEKFQSRIAEAETSDIGYSHALLNVGFWVGDTEIEPAAPVSVTVTVTGMPAGGDATVTHFLDDGETEVLAGDDVTTEEDSDGSAITFELPSFSDILVTYANGYELLAEGKSLDGDWVIINEPNNRALTSDNVNGHSPSALAATNDYTFVTVDGEQKVMSDAAQVWTFKKITSGQNQGQYYIYYTTTSGRTTTTHYLSISGTSVTVTTTATPLAIQMHEDSGTILIYNGNYYLNKYGGEEVFAAYGNDGSVNMRMSLYPSLDNATLSSALVYDLGFNSYQSFNEANSYLFKWGTPALWLQYKDGTWVANETGKALSLKNQIQTLSSIGSSLYSPASDFSYAPVYGGDSTVYVFGSSSGNVRKTLATAGYDCPPGVEIEFLGWQWMDASGTTYYFDCGAAAKPTASGIEITDVNGEKVTVPGGSTLIGRWQEVSNLALFFVNYAGTVLDVQTGSTSISQSWTPAIAIGRVYQPTKSINPQSNAINTKDINTEIRGLFASTSDGTDGMQLVIQYYALPTNDTEGKLFDGIFGANESESASFIAGNGLNPTELDKKLFQYVKTLDSDFTLAYTTADIYQGVKLNKKTADPDNYGVRWYCFKEQNDFWHIDGVLEAKTTQFSVYKTFVGLNETLRQTVLRDFQIAVGIKDMSTALDGDTSGNAGNLQLYMNMKAEQPNGEERYQYLGATAQEGADPLYHWSVYAIRGEYYGFKEKVYDIEDYSVTPEVVYRVRQSDGTIKMETKMGVDGISPADDGVGEALIGGNIESIYFYNYYTKDNTGALVIEKTDKSGNLLSGAKFTLTPKEGTTAATQTAVSDWNGLVFFSGLTRGTYTLAETEAPAGYNSTARTWTVTVTQTTSGSWNNRTTKITVTVKEDGKDAAATETVFENNQLTQRLTITNEPTSSTLVVKKVFEDLTPEELAQVVAGSAEGKEKPYYISIDGREEKLYLQNAVRTGDVFSWSVTDMTPGNHTLTEHNYLLEPNYTDTAVIAISAAYQNAALTVTKDRDAKTAAVLFDFTETPEGDNVLTLTNRYTDTFTLRLAKVDSVTGKRLPGAVFKIYGGYTEATDTSDRITVDGTTYYYKGSMTSDENGIATISGLKLTGGKGTFVYVMDETTAPDGYEKSSAYTVLQVDVTSENYSADGVYSIEFANTGKDIAAIDLTVQKVWADGEDHKDAVVQMNVYQSIDGKTITKWNSDYVSLTYDNSEGDWSNTWHVPKYYKDGDTYKEYTYYVTEEAVYVDGKSTNAYSVMYGDPRTNLIVDGEAKTIVAGYAVTGDDGNLHVTIKNAPSYELPHTGGIGTALYLLGGCGIMLLGLAGFAGRMRRRRENA